MIRSSKRIAAMLLSAAVVVALCACSTFYSDKFEGIPAEASAHAPDSESGSNQPFVAWDSDGQNWLLITWGSGSCPTAPTAVSETGPGRYVIETATEGGPFCTADLGPTTFVIPAPDGVTPEEDVIVDIGPGVEQVLGVRSNGAAG